MYAPDTILARKEFQDPASPAAAYNRVKVVGPSPVMHVNTASYGQGGNWSGMDGQGVLVEPLEGFNAIEDRPFGWLREHYNVESEPVIEVPVAQPIRLVPVDTRPSPEQVFADAAKATPAAPSTRKKPAA